MKQQHKPESNIDSRVLATGAIWGISVGLMAVTIPIAQFTQSPLIPLAVIGGATLGTCAVWYFGNKNQSNVPDKTETATQQHFAMRQDVQGNDDAPPSFSETLATKEDVRMEVSVRIWKVAALMLFISQLPRSGEPNQTIPLSIIAAAALTTGAIWLGGVFNQRSLPDTAQKNRLKELEERLANLETINNFERRLAEEALKRYDAKPNAAAIDEVAPDVQSETVIKA